MVIETVKGLRTVVLDAYKTLNYFRCTASLMATVGKASACMALSRNGC